MLNPLTEKGVVFESICIIHWLTIMLNFQVIAGQCSTGHDNCNIGFNLKISICFLVLNKFLLLSSFPKVFSLVHFELS